MRPMNGNDVPHVIAILSNPDMYEFVTDLDNADEGIQWINQVWDKRSYLFLTVSCLEQPEIIGLILFHAYPDQSLHFGGFISFKNWGKGYAGEIIQGLIAHLARTGSSHSIYVDVDIRHARVRRALEKGGVFSTGRFMDNGCMEYRLWPTNIISENHIAPSD